MFVVHGQNGNVSAIIGTSSARKAIIHMQRMTRSGLDVLVTDAEGRSCSSHDLLCAQSGRRKSLI